MPYIRMTLVKPQAGKEADIVALLKKLDGVLFPTPGMLFSAVIHDKDVPAALLRLPNLPSLVRHRDACP